MVNHTHFKSVRVSFRVKIRNIVGLELRVMVSVSVVSGELSAFLISCHLVAAYGQPYIRPTVCVVNR